MKPLVIAVLLIALVAGGALAAILAGGDEPVRPAATTTAETEETLEVTQTVRSDRETVRTEREPTASPRDESAIEQAVVEAAEAVEAGTPPPGIRPGDLPGSDELSIDSVAVHGDRGTAVLSSGAKVELERSGGRWRIVGVRKP